MGKQFEPLGIEINPKRVGVLLTDHIGDTLRLFCFYTNATISQMDVSAGENRDNLSALFVTLGMEETCSSFILDEVVQGRLYVKGDDKHWLYTLLKSSSDTLPALNADLASLPWRVAWLSRDTQVLEYGWPGDGEHCFCIRKEISEEDASRLVKNSKAFIKPVSTPRKQKPARSSFALILAMLASAMLISVAVIYGVEQEGHAPTQPAAVSTANTAAPQPSGFYLLYNHQISGPFPAKTIADLNTSGLFAQDVLCRAEGATDWIKPADAIHPPVKK
ncbi:MAG TPA: hypothetical protein VK815_07480 [Candidatus Acidoferrales bacterium]|jgi:hypothetical protein|nr:hypothetical protein [Candidatus Acidoferrales bacterium]